MSFDLETITLSTSATWRKKKSSDNPRRFLILSLHLASWSLQSGDLISEFSVVDNISLCASPCISMQRKQCHETNGASFDELSLIYTSGCNLDNKDISDDHRGNNSQNMIIKNGKALRDYGSKVPLLYSNI